MSRRNAAVPLVLVTVLAVLLGSYYGSRAVLRNPAEHRIQAAPAQFAPSGGRHVSQSLEWRRHGAAILTERRKAVAKLPAGKAASSIPADQGAYLSAPVDITGPGTYTLHFRVPSTFRTVATTAPIAYSFAFPQDLQMQIKPKAPFTPTHLAGGGVDLAVPVIVSDVQATYPALTVWLYR